jgi:hypothetical protein
MSTKLLESDDDVTEIDAEYDDISQLQGDIDGQLDSVVSEFAGEGELRGKIKVYRVEKGEGKMGWVFDCLPSELPIMERVKEEYGPGDYVSRFYVGAKLKRVFPFSIAAPRRVDLGQNPVKSSGDVSALAEVIKQSIDSLKSLIVQNNAPQNQPSMLEMQTHFMNQMVSMKSILGSDEKSGKNSPIADLREMMLLVDDLRGEKKDDEPKGIMDVMSSLLDKALPVLTQAAEKTERPRPALERKPTLNNPKDDGEKDMSFAMKMKLSFLCGMAAKDADPSTYAGLIIDQSDENTLHKLVVFLKDENWLEKLGEIHKPILEHANWFGLLKDEILGELFPDVDSGEKGGDTSDEITGANANNVHSSTENTNNDNP